METMIYPYSRAELEARIWRVSAPGTKQRPGAVLAARLTHTQATEMAEQLKRDGVDCLVNRV